MIGIVMLEINDWNCPKMHFDQFCQQSMIWPTLISMILVVVVVVTMKNFHNQGRQLPTSGLPPMKEMKGFDRNKPGRGQ